MTGLSAHAPETVAGKWSPTLPPTPRQEEVDVQSLLVLSLTTCTFLAIALVF